VSNRSRDRIEKYLYRQLTVLDNGEQLPSMRTIIQECQTSQSTVQAVLRQYEKKRLIISKNRRGYFKSENDTAEEFLGEVDLVYCTTAQSEDPLMKFHGEFSHLLCRYCGEKWRSVRMHYLETHADLDSMRQLASNNRCRACILVASPTSEMGAILEKNRVAYVNVFPHASQLDPNAVNIIIDNNQVIEKQLDHLVGLGHKRIAYLHNLRENEIARDMTMRIEAFYRLSLERGLPLNPEWIQLGGYNSDTCTASMRKILNTTPQPTAVICYDHHLPAVYRVLDEYKMFPGREFSVMSTDNLPITQVMSPQATSLDISRTQAAQQAIDALEKTLAGEAVGHIINIASDIVARNSTGPALNQ